MRRIFSFYKTESSIYIDFFRKIYDAFEEGAKVKERVLKLLNKYEIPIGHKSIQAGVYLIRKHDGKMPEISKQVLIDEINDL